MTGYGLLSRETLARLVPELLLSGHLIDRAGIPHVAGALGIDGIRDVSVDEWMAASPIYTRRMRAALGYDGDDVETIFKGLQLDIGAPPQFMDFRYTVHDAHHGEFALAHCGALMDVEPMGEALVHTMCHQIEDPTFDATAIATNPRARIRPIHRPPRVPAGRTPHCAWTVVIDDDVEPLDWPAQTAATLDTAAATFGLLTAVDPDEPGLGDYRGPLLADLNFAEWSHSALVRIAEEVCLQHQLLSLGFAASVRSRLGDEQGTELFRKQFTGAAGLTAERLRRALNLGSDLGALAEVLRLHPGFGPAAYTGVRVELDGDRLLLTVPRVSSAHDDGAWVSLLDADHLEPVRAVANAIDRRFDVVVDRDTETELRVAVTPGSVVHDDLTEVELARLSTGAKFEFVDRGRSLPVIARP